MKLRKHKCKKFKIVNTIKNEKGEKWFEECTKCGEKQIVLFNTDGDCVYVGKDLK